MPEDIEVADAPEVEAPEAEIEASEVEAPEVDAPETPVDDTPDWGARITEWGGEERVSDALAIAEALAHEEGIRALVTEGLSALGLDPEAALALAAGEEPPDPDALMTRAEFEAELKKRDQSFTERQREQAEAQAADAVESKLAALKVADDVERRMVLTFAQQYVEPDELDPKKLASAIEKGHAAYEAALIQKAEARLVQRKEKNDSVPSPLRGGGQPAGTEVEKPEGSTNFDDWKKAARKFLASQEDQNA